MSQLGQESTNMEGETAKDSLVRYTQFPIIASNRILLTVLVNARPAFLGK